MCSSENENEDQNNVN